MQVGHKICDLSVKEERVLSRKREVLDRALQRYFPSDKFEMSRLEFLDKAIYRDFISKDYCKEVDLRVSMGEIFVHQFGFRWVIAEDIHGMDFAVWHEGASSLIYPRLLVSKLLAERKPSRSSATNLYRKMGHNVRLTLSGANHAVRKMRQAKL